VAQVAVLWYGGWDEPVGNGVEHGEEDDRLSDCDAEYEEEEGRGADGTLKALARGSEEEHVEDELWRGLVKPMVGECTIELQSLPVAQGTNGGRRIKAELGDRFLFAIIRQHSF
jgi:hypothetical protein